MSTEIFSQSDIDALLDGRTDGQQRRPAGREGADEVQIYDFRRPNRVSTDRLRALEAMHERMSKAMEAWLIAKLRSPVEVSLQSVEQFSFGEFVMSLPTPCASFIFDVSGAGGQQGVIDLGLDLSFHVVDRLFGGAGDPMRLERGLTPIEKKANRLVAERVAALLVDTWQDAAQLEASISGFESVPEILQAAGREDPVLVTNLKVQAGAVSSLISICLPFASVEKFFSSQGSRRVKHPGGAGAVHGGDRAVTSGLLLETRIPLSARLPRFELSMKEVAALAEGSIIATGLRLDEPLEVWLGDEPRMRASAGRGAGSRNLALQILDALPRKATGATHQEDTP